MKRLAYIIAVFLAVVMCGNLVAAPEKVQASTKATQTQKAKPAKKGKKKDKGWANFVRYEQANKFVKNPVVVFMGDSITDGWFSKRKEFFKENNYVGRGISGQTTSHMLVRLDVIVLKPKAVAIMAGINDIAGNNGPIKLENIFGNIVSMAELAKANGIKVFLCSTLPSSQIPWRKDIKDVAEKVKVLNAMLKDYAKNNDVIYVDYYSKVVDDKGGLQKEYTYDGVHLNTSTYAILEQIIKEAIQREL